MDISKIISHDYSYIQNDCKIYREQLIKRGWCFIELPKDFIDLVNHTNSLINNFFNNTPSNEKQKYEIKRKGGYNTRFGYVSSEDREKFRLLTGNYLSKLAFPSPEISSNISKLSLEFDSICSIFIQVFFCKLLNQKYHEIIKLNRIPLINTISDCNYQNFGMLDIVHYYPNNKSYRVEEHGDPGLFSFSIGSSSPGLQMKDSDNWIDVPLNTSVLWIGSAAIELSNGIINAGIHRVKGSNDSRLTMWYEVCSIEQIPQDILNDNVDYKHPTSFFGNTDNSTFEVFAKTLTGKVLTLKGCTKNTTIEDLKYKIQELEGIPPDKNRIVYGGQVPSDLATLHELCAVKGSIFHLVLAL